MVTLVPRPLCREKTSREEEEVGDEGRLVEEGGKGIGSIAYK
jgi:hypothetical protein